MTGITEKINNALVVAKTRMALLDCSEVEDETRIHGRYEEWQEVAETLTAALAEIEKRESLIASPSCDAGDAANPGRSAQRYPKQLRAQAVLDETQSVIDQENNGNWRGFILGLFYMFIQPLDASAYKHSTRSRRWKA